MRASHLLSLLLVGSALAPCATAQESLPVPAPPTAEEAVGVTGSSGKLPTTPPAAEMPELLPPGKLSGPAIDNNRLRVLRPAPSIAPPAIRLPERPLSVVDAVVLTHNQVSDETLVSLIRHYGIERPLAVSDLVTLQREGVGQAVIMAMQECPPPVVAAPAPVLLAPPASLPVVIRQYRYVAPPVRYYYPPPPPPHHHYYGSGWGISVYGR